MISIIMPVLNEEKNIEEALKSACQLEGDYELIVVDGGSIDGTQKIAGKYAKVISARKGRARQMNAGARIAKGDILLFLHADCRLSQDSLIKIESALRDRKVVGGALKFHLDDDSSTFKAISYISNLRANISKVYTGDFGIFVRKSAFDLAGGFSEIELMEDICLCKKLKKFGRLVQPDSKIISSPRRMKKHGILKTWIHMQINRFLFFIGISPRRFSKFYRDTR
ncbi:MAG: TIGR04283 family arsenosugar biosynthesis glycosyltransferase [Candidatus Hydrothermarchaeaceae archaeon]